MSQATMKKYPAAFKERAVKLAADSDQPIAQTARDLGVNENTLHTWIGKYHRMERREKEVHDEHLYEELKRLRKENARLKEERDILKKAAAYFAQQLPAFSAKTPPGHDRERARKSLPGAALRADGGVRSARGPSTRAATGSPPAPPTRPAASAPPRSPVTIGGAGAPDCSAPFPTRTDDAGRTPRPAARSLPPPPAARRRPRPLAGSLLPPRRDVL